MKEMTLTEFIAKTASKDPTPGGGGVAALVSACGASLVSMLANLTTDEAKFPNDFLQMQQIAEKLTQNAAELLEFIDKDAEVFNEYMSALKMPKATEEQIAVRKEVLKNAVVNATNVPLELAEVSFQLMDVALYVVEHGNPNAVSDGAIGGMLLKAGVLSALYNVKINLPSIKDEALKAHVQQRVDFLTEQCREKEAEILKKVGF